MIPRDSRCWYFAVFDAAEMNESLAASFQRCHAALDVLFNRHFEMAAISASRSASSGGFETKETNAGQRPPQRAH